MALIKRLTKQGNSYSLIIDKALIELLGIEPDTPLELSTTDGKSLTVRPVRDEDRKKRFGDALSQVNQKHSRALKKLAE